VALPLARAIHPNTARRIPKGRSGFLGKKRSAEKEALDQFRCIASSIVPPQCASGASMEQDMQPPHFFSIHALAVQRGDGLLPELVGLAQSGKVCPSLVASTTAFVPSRNDPIELCIDPEGSNLETLDQVAHWSTEQTCSIRFDSDRTIMIVIRAKSYGRGYASPYFAHLAGVRLGIPLNRIRIFYSGDHPAAKISVRELTPPPSRESVGVANADIGDMIERLCSRTIEKGR
jgi:hypothetical protein